MRQLFLFLVAALLVCSSCSHSRRLHKKAHKKEAEELTVTASAKDKKYTPESYISTWRSAAIKQMREYGIPASIVLAQAMLESGNGNSVLAREANNHFGVKCTRDWNGKTYHKNGDGNNDCFRKYSNTAESFSDHSKFLQKSRYASLFDLGSTDYRAWAKGLKKTGYATNPNYPELLINLVEKYHLQQYDQ